MPALRWCRRGAVALAKMQPFAIGSVVGLAIAAANASTALVAGMAVLLCASVGALIGLLLWCECDELPADIYSCSWSGRGDQHLNLGTEKPPFDLARAGLICWNWRPTLNVRNWPVV